MIEKNVPMDAGWHNGLGGRKSSYPFMEMELGDSVFYGDRTKGLRAYDAAKKYQSRSGDRKFSARRIDGGVRIWRTA